MFSNLFSNSIDESKLLEGHMIGIRLKGKPILLAKVDGQVYAVSDICPHAGCHLHSGILTKYSVMCPCHGWRFDIRNGQFEGNMLTKLESYGCKVEQGKIHVNL